MFDHGFFGLVKAGGFTLIFIAICSILVLAIAVERLAVLWRFVDRARALAETIKRCLYRGALADARTACERSSSAMADVFLIGFERLGRSSPEALTAAVERERQRVAITLKGQLWILGTVGATAPFVGLFGTVWGIMRAFRDIGITKNTGMDVVAPGISEALITTAFGIVVAIEAVVVYNYFQARMLKTTTELRLMAEEFVELLHEKPVAAATSSKVKIEKTEKAEKIEKAEKSEKAAEKAADKVDDSDDKDAKEGAD